MAKLAKKLNVDGVRLLPYHFDEYPQNTYNSQNKGLTVFNDKELEELEKEIEKFIKITNKNGFYTNYKSFLRQIPEYYRNGKTIENCYAGNMFCTIDSKGNFYPCFPISSNMNINEIKFNKIWKSNEINHLRNNAIKNNNCKKCFQACYKEMSMRTSPISLLKNFKNQFRELSFFTD